MRRDTRFTLNAAFGVLCAAALICGARWVAPASAQAAARTVYDFEDGPQGFTPIVFKDNALSPDASSTASLDKAAKVGSGALNYTYKVEPGAFRVLFAEQKLPAGTQSVRFWVRSSVPTALLFSAREEQGANYQLTFYVPAHEWVQLTANLDEFQPDDEGKDPNKKLDAEQVTGLSVSDIATMLVNAPDEAVKNLPNLQGQRTQWLDDLHLLTARVPQSRGKVKEEARESALVDNFEGGVIRWIPVKVNFGAAAPTFEVFPLDASLKVLSEAAGPGAARTALEPGGKGMRFAYTRAAGVIFAVNRQVEKDDLTRANRLKLSLNLSRKSLVLIQLKEKDGSEYQYLLMPENTVGWQNLDVPITEFTRSESSTDENNTLDAGQIKEISILDASAFMGLETGDTTMDLDAVFFGLQ